MKKVPDGEHVVQVSYLGYRPQKLGIYAHRAPFVAFSLAELSETELKSISKCIIVCGARSAESKPEIETLSEPEDVGTPKPPTLSTNYFADHTRILFTAEAVTQGRLRIFDVQGRLLRDRPELVISEGDNELLIPRDGLASGIYWYVLQWGDQTARQKMVVLP